MAGNSTLEKNIYHESSVVAYQDIVIEVISAQLVSSNFGMDQNIGEFLGNFMHLVFNDTLRTGFSMYSAEKCHEHVHGNHTCNRFLAQDLKCVGESIGSTSVDLRR